MYLEYTNSHYENTNTHKIYHMHTVYLQEKDCKTRT